MDDDVFKALADSTRREILDSLFIEDGLTLSAIEAKFSMTRFGVMKHIKVLVEAGLIVERRKGREKLHFLNPVPIRLVHDRWVSKYAAPVVSYLSELKQDLEKSTMEKVYEIYIKTTPERLWHAITDTESRAKYNFGLLVESDWTPGSTYVGRSPKMKAQLHAKESMQADGEGMPLPTSDTVILEGENIEVDPPRKLVQSFFAKWGEDVIAVGKTRVTWEIVQVGDSCRLTVTHDQLPADANAQLYGGWPMILSGLKTLLESGELLTTPGSLMYMQS